MGIDLSYNKGLTAEIGSLKKPSNIILVGCSFSGLIPPTIGSLQELISLSLNSNRFSGRIPSSTGSLSTLYWLDLADNNLEGPIPVFDAAEPGPDMLSHCKRFHLGMSELSGTIPSKLFSSNMSLIHVRFMLTGPIPLSLNSLINVSQLFLSNNKLSGPAPDLTGMNLLHYVDLSNNSFDVSDVTPWFSTLESLTTLMMEDTQLQGDTPAALFSLSNLQTVLVQNPVCDRTGASLSYCKISQHLMLSHMKHCQITVCPLPAVPIRFQAPTVNVHIHMRPL